MLTVNVGKEPCDVSALKQHLALENLASRFRSVVFCCSFSCSAYGGLSGLFSARGNADEGTACLRALD